MNIFFYMLKREKAAKAAEDRAKTFKQGKIFNLINI